MNPSNRPPDEREMREFLLGRLSQERRDELQEQFFSDERLYDSLVEAEQDLIDEYVRGDLNSKDSRLVEDGLLATVERNEDLRFARALWLAERRRKRPAKQPRHWLIAAAAAVAAIGISGWFAGQNQKLRNELAESRPAKTAPAGSVQPALRPSAPGAVASFVLVPQLRGPTVPSFQIAANVELVRFDFADVKGSGTYSLQVERNGGAPVWTRDGLTPSAAGAITVWLPAQVLTPGNYEFLFYTQSGQRKELAASYQCQIVRR